MNIYILMDWNRYVYVMNIIYNSYVCSKLELRYYYFFFMFRSNEYGLFILVVVIGDLVR